jgi:hypothetical protein
MKIKYKLYKLRFAFMCQIHVYKIVDATLFIPSTINITVDCRLISERTVEENILKKANQKRMLGDMAIEGGNFTTTFFKEVICIHVEKIPFV